MQNEQPVGEFQETIEIGILTTNSTTQHVSENFNTPKNDSTVDKVDYLMSNLSLENKKEFILKLREGNLWKWTEEEVMLLEKLEERERILYFARNCRYTPFEQFSPLGSKDTSTKRDD